MAVRGTEGTGPGPRARKSGIEQWNASRAAAIRGAGGVLQPSFTVGADLAAGRLVPVLPGYRVSDVAIQAVYPPGRHLSAKVRSFVDFLTPRFGERPAWDLGCQNPTVVKR